MFEAHSFNESIIADNSSRRIRGARSTGMNAPRDCLADEKEIPIAKEMLFQSNGCCVISFDEGDRDNVALSRSATWEMPVDQTTLTKRTS